MTVEAHSDVTDRIDLIVSGNFNADAIGPAAYDRVLRAVQADPATHLRAFADTFVRRRPTPDMLTELDLPRLLKVVAPLLPAETRQVAAALSQRMAQSAGAREAVYEAFDEAGRAAIDRGRRMLDQRRQALARITA